MATKPYPQTEEMPRVVSEPVATYQAKHSTPSMYQVTDTERESIMRAKEQFARGEFCTESEMDKMVSEWVN